MSKKFICLGLSAILISCATHVDSISLKRRQYDEPALNKFVTRETGKNIFTSAEEDYIEAVKIEEMPNFKMIGTKFPYRIGDTLPLSGQTDKWYLYYKKETVRSSSFDYHYKNGSYQSTSTKRDFYGIAISKIDKSIILPFDCYGNDTGFGGFSTQEIKGLQTTEVIYKGSNFCNECSKKEFIFNSKVGDILKFTYREYRYNMAKPVMNKELQFDLKEGKLIEFKGLVIQILNATDSKIDYRILSTFSKV